ncbi:hypothetical protein [Piscibacillus salipiscarius]|uniref:Uncharacterized protein n=1 Tax=Piscibacillus salipiscarius TaxID=299480 RepID=A0ABW5QCF8_9BACI
MTSIRIMIFGLSLMIFGSTIVEGTSSQNFFIIIGFLLNIIGLIAAIPNNSSNKNEH